MSQNHAGSRQFRQQLFLAFVLTLVVGPLAGMPAAAGTAKYGPDTPPDGISSAGWQSILHQIAEQESAARPAEDGEAVKTWRLTNRAQAFEARFGSHGIRVMPGGGNPGWSWGLTLVGAGPAGGPSRVEPVEPVASGNRIEYRRPGLTEWYVNERRGVEHGFTIAAPIAGSSARLELLLDLTGTLDASVGRKGDGLTLRDGDGAAVLAYGDLHAYDASGRTLAARMELEPASVGVQRLRIAVDVAGAVYPVIVDPLISTEVKKLTASDAAAEDEFGFSVSISGDTVVVGALQDDDAGFDSGSVYVFERNQGGADNWGEVQKLTAADGAVGDLFGGSVSISGDTVAVGAYRDDDAGTDSGSAYVFERNQGGANNWGQVQKLTASDAAAEDEFGFSVSIGGDTVVVGAYQDDDAGFDSGSVYVFERNQGGANNWGEVQKLTAADAAELDSFGYSVSISGDAVVVGAHLDDEVGADSGSAYVFERNQGGASNWGQVQKLTAADAAAGDSFGSSVSISGDTVVVGAYQDDDAGADSGSAYVFERNQGGANNWGQAQKLTAADGAAGDRFGSSVSISGDTVVVGAAVDDDAGSSSGSAYVFERNRGGADNWGETQKLTASDGAAGDQFGSSVSISGDTVVVGANFDDHTGTDSGSAYAFTIAGCEWNQFAKTVDADGEAGDRFGYSVAISGDTVVVGGLRSDGAVAGSGSAYVFERNQGGADNWGQVQELIAADAEALDQFGVSVSISGDTVVVGADQDDDPGSRSGSAYVFERNQGGANNWGQVQKLTASDGATGDSFGNSVSISGDTVVVGAYLDFNFVAGLESGSAYVFERNQGGTNNWGQVQKLNASDAAPLDRFGLSVSISGDTVVVGAYLDDDAGSASGSAYLFGRNQGGASKWGQMQKLNASDAAASDQFGYSVSISGDTVVVGASGNDDVGAGSGSAYLFERNQGGADNWGQVEKLTASDGAAGDQFGYSISISGDTVVVGANLDDHTGTDSGSAYVFERNQGGANHWGQVQKLTASDAAASDLFGLSVSISGDTVVVGADQDDDAGAESGSAYVLGFGCPVCGDGLTEPPEGCDDGAGNSDAIPDACRTDCTPAGCGDGVADTAEDCDDGGETAACDADCTFAECGDGILNVAAGEFCDDGGETAVCDVDCTAVACGDGVTNVTAGEVCDDAGASASCDADCTPAVCGDGVWNPSAGEACDDGNVLGGDGCAADCSSGCASSDIDKLVAQAAAEDDWFGRSVSISGDTVVVGVPGDDDAGTDSGSAYVFERSQGGADNWGQVQKLTGADASPVGDRFGWSVSISGDTVVVGAPYDAGTDFGAAYVFERNEGGANNWGQVQKLTFSGGSPNDWAGYFVSISGDTVAVGVPRDDDPDPDSGSVYVFERNQGGANNWGEVQKLTASDGAALDQLGWSVSIHGDMVVAGAHQDDDAGTDSGSAYVFERNQGGANNWGQVQKLTASDGAAGDYFGLSVSIHGDTAAVGAYRHDGADTDSGAAYVFERNQGGANNWGQVQKLSAVDVGAGDRFGASVSISGNVLVVGSDDENGSAWSFRRNVLGAWGEVLTLAPVDGSATDYFGYSVSISGHTIVVGAWLDDGAGSDLGSAYVFERACPGEPVCGDGVTDTGEDCDDGGATATCDVDCTPSECGDGVGNVAAGEFCDDGGESASCDADCTVVECGDGLWNGAAGEACDDAGTSATCDADCTLAVCGDGIPNALAGEFCDDGNVLGGDACAVDCSAGCDSSDIDRLVAQGAAAFRFGQSVSISADTVVAGAIQASPTETGSAYVLERDHGGADDWGQVQTLIVSDGTWDFAFGMSVSISGDTVVVGTYSFLSEHGSAFVFERDQGGADNWGQVQQLIPAGAVFRDRFGVSVSISGDTVVVGADSDDGASAFSGSAYVFERNQGGANHWGQVQKLIASDGAAGDLFGSSVSIRGDTVVVGAEFYDGASAVSGSAYVFERNQGGADNWGEVQMLTASDGAARFFGSAVSIGGDAVVVGAPRDGDAGSDSGSAYVFERNQGGVNNWGEVQRLTASDGGESDQFGYSVSISGDAVVVGAYQDDDAGSSSGSAYVFERDQGGADNWGEVQKLTAADAAQGDRFGVSVSISGDTVVVGADEDDGASTFSGSAYVFDSTCSGAPGETSSAWDMRASRNDSNIDVTYTPACGATDHAAYVGIGPALGSAQWLASHCGLGVDGALSFDPGPLPAGQFAYFVIVGYDGDDEGSYGTDSGGAERSEATGLGSCDLPVGPSTCE